MLSLVAYALCHRIVVQPWGKAAVSLSLCLNVSLCLIRDDCCVGQSCALDSVEQHLWPLPRDARRSLTPVVTTRNVCRHCHMFLRTKSLLVLKHCTKTYLSPFYFVHSLIFCCLERYSCFLNRYKQFLEIQCRKVR